MLFRAIHSRSRRSRLRRHVRRAAECQKLASLLRALSAVVDDSGPVQHRPRACRTCPCVAHLASRAGPETAYGKSSPGPLPNPTTISGWLLVRRPRQQPFPRHRARHRVRHPADPYARPQSPPGTPRASDDAPRPPSSGASSMGVGRCRKGAPRRRGRRRAVP